MNDVYYAASLICGSKDHRNQLWSNFWFMAALFVAVLLFWEPLWFAVLLGRNVFGGRKVNG